MKNLFLLMIGIALLTSGCTQKDVNNCSCNFIGFKYYNGEKFYLGQISNDYILIGIDTNYSDLQIKDFISTTNTFAPDYQYTIYSGEGYMFKEIPIKLSTPKTCNEITKTIADLNKNTIVSYVHYTMQTDDCTNDIWEPIGNMCVNSYGSSFFIKVFDETDLSMLYQKIAETNTELVQQSSFMPKWFEIRATKNSMGDALKMANYFQESGLFEASDVAISKYPVE
ncbi:MAG: hypothetical protein Q4A56_06995 [Porphyromonadaceae bacterium]|nr:hypothetical protein [Porphyromonadaceae bacterium]